MPFVFSAPPAIRLDRIQEHLARAYGVSGTLHAIAAERDQNIRVEAGSGHFLLKVCSPDEGFALTGAQAAALQHIAVTAPDLPVPRVIRTRAGGALAALEHESETYPTLLFTWLEGEVLGGAAQNYLKDFGTLLARLGKALRGFAHPALLERNLVWDVMRADELRAHAHLLGPTWALRADTLLAQFAEVIKPKLRYLRAQTIHGDAHPFNVLHSDGKLSGVIDFGDMVHAPLIIDLANTLADCLTGEGSGFRAFDQLIPAYHAVTPLERGEADLIVPLVKVRLLSGAIISMMRQDKGLGVTLSIQELCAESLSTVDSIETQEDRLKSLCLQLAGHASRQPIQSSEAMQRRMAAMGPKPLLFYSKPLHIVRGDGVWLHADDGRAYLDCYNNVAHVGHAHPVVADAIARQLHTVNTNTRYLTDESIRYAEELKATLHPLLDTVIFVNSGSEANDVAWRMAKVFTGNSGALCMDFAYHGVTAVSDAVSPSNYPEGKWNFPHVRQLEAPDLYRGPYGADRQNVGEAYAALADGQIASLRQEGFGVAYAILDSAFMTNGILDAPGGYVKGIVERTHKAGGLFVADEVQSGFGRMGSHMWGHQRHGVVPDFVTIGKPAGNGYPVGAIITRAEILERFVVETGPFFSTFGGGNAACTAGLAVLDVMRHEALMENAESTGKYFRENLMKLMQKHEIIGDIRGIGLAIGVELVQDRKAKSPAKAETRRVLDLMRDEGVLIGSDGKLGNVLKLRPPLVFRPEHADQVVSALDRVLSRL